eukprot:TRINITY_DN1702_c0_g1_i1.p1 TRINITY_DN1702_c0_g1~~TRINITY_DN1702_c0_g1_i1.p1  ORF type:complete len:289 (+),score=50.92 TRINITY_DN1702_c0_g1_i1:232-1098(+)
MEIKQRIDSAVFFDKNSQEFRFIAEKSDNGSIKSNYSSLLVQSKKELDYYKQALQAKRFPKEVFMPPIRIRRRLSTNTFQSQPLKLIKQSSQQISTPGLVSNFPRAQRIQTPTLPELTNKLELPPLPRPLLSPASFNSASSNLNQKLNLEMAFKTLSIGAPRVDLIRVYRKGIPMSFRENGETAHAKPAQRNIYSRQDGAAKTLISRNFTLTGIQTDPKQEPPKIFSGSSLPAKHTANTKNILFFKEAMKELRRDKRKNGVGARSCRKVEKLCDVTFGRNEFRKEIEI